MQIIRPTEFAAFATLADSGAVCDANGVPQSGDDASCVIFGTLSDAEAFCRERVAQSPSLRFDILDAADQLRPPLFTIVNPSRAAAIEGSPAKIRRNTRWAIAQLAVEPPFDLVRLGVLRRRAGDAYHSRHQRAADRGQAGHDELQPHRR